MKPSTSSSEEHVVVGYAPSEGTPDIGEGDVIDGRYHVLGRLGRGGMADVYHVRDERMGRELALKRHRAYKGSGRLARLSKLFEREFAMLAQIDHPTIIRVHDYGFDDGVPYYTMERLRGQDLREQGSTDWRTLCSWLRQIASALALLHSRHLLHRDVTPHNVWITEEGVAKLIDFGAMTWMGVETRIVGTPPFIPPEAVNGQSLDGRADLYALGATAYWALTRRHAYSARTMAELPACWQKPLAEPAECNGEPVPPELVTLVMSLLSLEPVARPASAAEVMDRLGAIAGLPADEQLAVAHAYLSTPTLVGRDQPLTVVRRELHGPKHGRGGALVIEGSAGTGRSRFVDACAIEAKLLGLSVLRADASDAIAGDYGVAAELVRQLEGLEPKMVRETAVARPRALGTFVPEAMAEADPPAASEADDPTLRGDRQEALLGLFSAVSRRRLLCIAVDDAHRVDEPSLALLATLAQDAAKLPLVLVLSADTDAEPVSVRAMQVLGDAAKHIELANLGSDDTEKLVRSVFGDVPNVSSLAARIHELSRGNPRATMELAQHLVRSEVLRYKAGAWSIPVKLGSDYLPASLTELFAERLEDLSRTARELAELETLSQGDHLDVDDFPELLGKTPEATFRAIDELVDAQVLIPEGLQYRFAHPGWMETLRARTSTERRRELHVRLASFLAGHGAAPPKVAAHLLLADQPERALEVLLPHVVETVHNEQVIEGALQAEPWVLERVWKLARAGKATRAQCQALCSWLTAKGVYGDVEGAREAAIQGVRALAEQAALTDFFALDPQMPPAERMKRAFGAAQARYEQAPEAERGFPPPVAVKFLARHVVHVLGLAAANLDGELVKELPSLAPLAALSPALGMVDALRRSVGSALTLGVHTIELNQRMFELLDRPDRGGLQPNMHGYMRLGVVMGRGLADAAVGKASALEWADELEKEPLHASSAWQVRAIYYMSLGDNVRAASCRKQVERLLIQRAPHQRFGATHLRAQLQVQAAMDDLLGLKRSIEQCEQLASSYASWQPFVHFARAHYLRVLGNLEEAQLEVDRGLRIAPAGRHILWSPLAAADVELEALRGHPRQAVSSGESHLETAAAEEIEHPLITLALISARAGIDPKGALELVQELIARLEKGGCAGVLLGMAWQARARLAVVMRDDVAFDEAAKHCAEAYRHGHSSLLSSKYERLVLEAKRAGVGISRTVEAAANGLAAGADLGPFASVITQILTCSSKERRQEQALALLMEGSGASIAHLFEVTPHIEVRLAYSLGNATGAVIPPGLIERLRDHGRLHFGVANEPANDTDDGMHTYAVTQTTAELDDTADLVTWDGCRTDVFLLQPGRAGLPMQAAVLGWPPGRLAEVDDRLLRAVQSALSMSMTTTV